MNEKALIIDGNSIINRAFFAIRNMSTPDGFPTGALFGFLNIYDRVKEEVGAKRVAVAFDLKGPTHRHKVYDKYKAGRKGMPDELAMQLPVLKEILQAMGVSILELQGFEADDLLGASSVYLNKQGIDAYILTGDRDALQLVNPNTSVYYHGTKNKIIYTPEKVKEDMGVLPERVIDLKGLMGDTSDNIPGIAGVGKVTALKLLGQFETVEAVISGLDEIKNKRLKGLVEMYSGDAILSKQLATIVTELPIDFELSDFNVPAPNYEILMPLLKKYRLNQFIDRLSKISKDELSDYIAPKLDVLDTKKIDVAPSANAFIKTLLSSTHTLFILTLYDKITLVSDNLDYLAIGYGDSFAVISGDGIDGAMDGLRAYNGKIPLSLIGPDLKQTLLILRRYGVVNVQSVFDPKIAMYLIDANRSQYNLEDMTLDLIGQQIMSSVDLIGKGAKQKKYSEIATKEAQQFLVQHLSAVVQLYPMIVQQLEDAGSMDLFTGIEMPLVKVLADMEYEGFNVDLSVLDALHSELSELINQLEKDIYVLAGKSFNIASPKQLGSVLFEDLGLPASKKTKTGYSTSHDVLEKLLDKHDIISKIIDYRTYTKLMSTYVDGLRAVVNPITGKIHSSLNQTVAATGRLSSKDPNLQNIPVKLEMGRRLRKVFVASEGNQLVDADYSQIELRVLAHMSDDEMLKKAYTDGLDIHALTASQVFDVPLEEVTPTIRSNAKEVNFGIVYGMSDFGLSDTLHITRAEAKKYIDNYFLKYPKVKTFMKKCVDECKQTGYSETMLGRKRNIPEIKQKNFHTRQYGERMAMNTPIQGTAADIIKKAMVDVDRKLRTEDLKSKLILQVHDELIIDTHPDEVLVVQTLLREAMESAVSLNVPLSVDMKVGESWYDTK